MRRVAAMVLAVLTLTSCAPKEATPITKGFSCAVDVSCDQTSYHGTLEVHDKGNVVFTLSEPPSVAGLQLAFSSEQLKVTFAGMELSLSDTQVPAGAVVRILGKAFVQAADPQTNTPSCDVQGVLDGVAYELRFDKANGFPLSLSVPAYALTATFSNWQTFS